ncbi:hypothetical protein D3C85_1587170 [compost metagenome]
MVDITFEKIFATRVHIVLRWLACRIGIFSTAKPNPDYLISFSGVESWHLGFGWNFCLARYLDALTFAIEHKSVISAANSLCLNRAMR